MRKIICMLIIVMVIVSMAVPAYAVTPSFDVPDVPDFSGIKFDIKFELPDSIWDKWFENHPIKFELPDDFWSGVKMDFFGG